MSEQKWTLEPWAASTLAEFAPHRILPVDAFGGVRSDGPIGDVWSDHNRTRIVQCVNACAGLPDPAAEIARLRGVEESYAKIMGVVGAYMTLPEQLKGEAFRDIDGTYRVLSGQCKPDESRGWPACFEREAEGRRKAEMELDKLRTVYAAAVEECRAQRSTGAYSTYAARHVLILMDAHDAARAEAGMENL